MKFDRFLSSCPPVVAIVPGKGTVSVWAPELDAKGNSVLGAFALERLVQLTGWHHD